MKRGRERSCVAVRISSSAFRLLSRLITGPFCRQKGKSKQHTVSLSHVCQSCEAAIRCTFSTSGSLCSERGFASRARVKSHKPYVRWFTYLTVNWILKREHCVKKGQKHQLLVKRLTFLWTHHFCGIWPKHWPCYEIHKYMKWCHWPERDPRSLLGFLFQVMWPRAVTLPDDLREFSLSSVPHLLNRCRCVRKHSEKSNWFTDLTAVLWLLCITWASPYCFFVQEVFFCSSKPRFCKKDGGGNICTLY